MGLQTSRWATRKALSDDIKVKLFNKGRKADAGTLCHDRVCQLIGHLHSDKPILFADKKIIHCASAQCAE